MSQVTIEQAMQLATARHRAGHLAKAEAIYRQVLSAQPNHPEALHLLGVIAGQVGREDAAIALIRQAITLAPHEPSYHCNLGVFLQKQGQLDQAIASFRQALALKPDYPEAHHNLGIAWKDSGQIDRAIACYRKALALKPDFVDAHDNLLFAMLHQSTSDPHGLFVESQHWNREHAEPLRRFIQPHNNDRDPERRLRIGYISADFRGHPVGRFMLPLLSRHDRQAVEVFCYAQVHRPDEITAQLRANADAWRSIVGMTDQQVVETVRQDRIDILVDLAMHTANNRLLVFARRPAPVQVTYLAYANGAVLSTIDYRLTDRFLEPDEATDEYSFQKPIRLDGTYWCYQQSIATGPVNELPSLKAGRLTLGCLNNFCKVTLAAMEIWARLLRELPNSQLLLYSPAGAHRDGVVRFFADRGITADRLEIISHAPHEEYFATYRRIDIALDTFPYAGGTTTCDALWMGVPVVTLAGQTPVGRVGVSILSNAGLPELIARDLVQYAGIVADLAGDLPRLAALRKSLRQRIQASSLMDAESSAREIENAYRIMWRIWCEKP
jgi:protein O-GlcNAc transferase